MKTGLFLSTALLLLPLASFAATYDYIDANGIVQSVQAGSANEAMARATNMDLHSGVKLDAGALDVGDNVFGVGGSGDASGTHLYHYIDRNGIVQDVRARNEVEAMGLAVNMDPHSGVKLDQGMLQQGDTVAP